ncbi:MAG: hypothetical protein ABW194_10130 [Novosphingobium sp.]
MSVIRTHRGTPLHRRAASGLPGFAVWDSAIVAPLVQLLQKAGAIRRLDFLAIGVDFMPESGASGKS